MTTHPNSTLVFACKRVLPLAAALLAIPLRAQTTAPASGSNDTVVLSPFQVSAGSEHGYLATETLSGTRLRTDLKDIGSSLTVFTDQMMDDLGAHGVADLMMFAPNTDPFVMTTSDTIGSGNNFVLQSTQFVSRGGSSTIVAQDFFANDVPQDRYNSEALTFTRGPNAILFGLGNSAGAVLSSTKRAKFKNATTIEEQLDSRGGHRNVIDVNWVLVPKRLAFRFANLLEGLNDFRINNNTYQRRHFATLTFTPFERTTLRVNYEWGHIQASGMRPWPDYDAVSPWLAAGKPLIDTYSAKPGAKPAGIRNMTSPGPVSTELSPGGTKVPTMVMLNQGQTAPTTYANGFPVNGASFRSLMRPDLYPEFASNFGNTAYRLLDYHIASAFLEQQITQDLFLEAAVNKVHNRAQNVLGFIGQFTYIYADPNKQLPNGAPNPNVGLLYSQSQASIIDAPTDATNARVMASYEFDFARHASGWLQNLGRHQAAVFVEQDDTSGWSSSNALYNTTPLATTGPAAALTNAANQIQFRYYFDPANHKVGTSAGRHLEAFPTVYANQPLPARDPSGITPAFLPIEGPRLSEALVKTKAVALQSFFWKDRIVLTNGVRRDDEVSWAAVPDDFQVYRDANGLAPYPAGFNVRKFAAKSRLERGGPTYTHGIVYHVLPWLSLKYNTSDNFQVNTNIRNIYGDLLPNPRGKGSDYGLTMSLLDQRVFIDLTYYTNESINSPDAIAITPAGPFKAPFDQIWEAIATYSGDLKYQSAPYSTLGGSWSDVVSTSSKGWEMSVTANPTPRLRLMVNGSVRGNFTTAPRGTYVNQYMAQYVPIIKSHADWLTVPTQGGETVGQLLADLQQTQTNFNAIRNSPSANFASKWTLNLITTYDVPPMGWVKGFSVGASMNARGGAIAGFAENANQILDPSHPYTAPSYATFGAWLTYRRKLFHDKVDWRVQLNVRNLFDDNTLSPLVIVDSRDGNHTPSTAIYNLREPRTFLLTNTFKF